MSLYDMFTKALQDNQIMQAALVAAPATALAYSARAVPKAIWVSGKNLASVEVRFNSDMPDYEAISRYITESIVNQRFSRQYTYQTEGEWNPDDNRENIKHHGLTIGYGTHWGFYKRHLVAVNRHLDDAAQTAKFKEWTNVTFFTFSKSVVKEFSQELASKVTQMGAVRQFVPIHINSGSHWNRAGKLPLRSISTVFTTEGVGRDLLDSIKKFEESKERHHELGLPHHMGILLFGVPGCGKSSLIHSLASETGRSIHYLNLGSLESDKELTDLVANGRDWSNTLLVLEDFDASGITVKREPTTTAKGKKEKEKSPVTLSALLNVLDGIISPDGLITIATTNHPERLDEALLRSGRFDHTVELGLLGYGEMLEMCRLFDVDPALIDMTPDQRMSGADMRSMILKKVVLNG